MAFFKKRNATNRFFLPQQLETSKHFYDNSIKTLNQQVQFTPLASTSNVKCCAVTATFNLTAPEVALTFFISTMSTAACKRMYLACAAQVQEDERPADSEYSPFKEQPVQSANRQHVSDNASTLCRSQPLFEEQADWTSRRKEPNTVHEQWLRQPQESTRVTGVNCGGLGLDLCHVTCNKA